MGLGWHRHVNGMISITIEIVIEITISTSGESIEATAYAHEDLEHNESASPYKEANFLNF